MTYTNCFVLTACILTTTALHTQNKKDKQATKLARQATRSRSSLQSRQKSQENLQKLLDDSPVSPQTLDVALTALEKDASQQTKSRIATIDAARLCFHNTEGFTQTVQAATAKVLVNTTSVEQYQLDRALYLAHQHRIKQFEKSSATLGTVTTKAATIICATHSWSKKPTKQTHALQTTLINLSKQHKGHIELHANKPIPQAWQDWLNARHIITPL